MEKLSKIIRGIASIPGVGGLFVLILGFSPLLLVIPLNLSNGISMIIGGLLMAAWCYFLSAKKIINIVTPLIPIPLWILGVVMAIAGVYGIITNKWDETETTPEVSMPEVKQSIQEPAMVEKPEAEPEPESEQITKHEQPEISPEIPQQSSNADQDKAAEYALEQMEKALEDMKVLEKTLGAEKIQEIYDAQGVENTVSFEEAMAEMQKQIDDLKRQGYGG